MDNDQAGKGTLQKIMESDQLGEKPIGTPSNMGFSGEGQKIGAFLVQLLGHKKSRKRLFINDLRLSFCGERGIRTPGTVIPYVSLANWWFQPLTHLT